MEWSEKDGCTHGVAPLAAPLHTQQLTDELVAATGVKPVLRFGGVLVDVIGVSFPAVLTKEQCIAVAATIAKHDGSALLTEEKAAAEAREQARADRAAAVDALREKRLAGETLTAADQRLVIDHLLGV